MSAVLIAVILALVLGHAAPQLGALRRFGWFRDWLAWLSSRLTGNPLHRGTAGILVSLGLPLLAVGLVQALLDGRFYGLPGFAFALIVLFWCWGPRDLDLDVDAVAEAPDIERRRAAAAELHGPDRPAALDAPSLVEGVFRGALERWFGVLLWFVLLGPVGALLYRLAQVGAMRACGEALPEAHADAYRRLHAILDWPAAQLATLGLALAGNFDAVLGAWRRWHAERGQGWFVLDAGFLIAAGRASVDCEVAEENDTEFGEDAPPPPAAPLPALKDAMSLAWRVLLLWLAVLAVIVLAGWVD
jgi:AmpE protein